MGRWPMSRRLLRVTDMREPPTYRRASNTPTLAPPERANAAKRGYGSAWQRERNAVGMDNHACEECWKNGLATKATHLDHVTTRRRGGLDHKSNYQRLCDTCHDRKTATHDGGFGNKVK